MSWTKKVKCWHVLIPAIVLIEITLACIYLFRKVQDLNIIQDRTSQYILLAVFCAGMLLLVLVVAIVFGCQSDRGANVSLYRLSSRLSRQRSAKKGQAYKIRGMVYPPYTDTYRTNKLATKHRKLKKGSIFFSKSKPFYVSSDSFQYQHGSQYGGEYRDRNFSSSSCSRNTQDISRVEKASVSTNVHCGASMDDLDHSRCKATYPKGNYTSILNNIPFGYLDTQYKRYDAIADTPINPSVSDKVGMSESLMEYDCGQDPESCDVISRTSGPRVNASLDSNAPILVASGTYVKYRAPVATNLHSTIYNTQDVYSNMYKRQHQVRIRSNQTNQHVNHMLSDDKQYIGGTRDSYNHRQVVRYQSRTQSHSTCYRVIRPKVIGAPVTVMVD